MQKVVPSDESSAKKALLIQTNESVFLHDTEKPEHLEELIGEGFTINLDVLRGLQDRFYFALNSEEYGRRIDRLHVFDFPYDDDTKEFKVES